MSSKKKKRKASREVQGPWSPILPLAVGFMAFLVFLPTAWNGFINMDDLPLIVNSRLLNNNNLLDLGAIFSHSLYSPHYKPLVYLSWMLEKTFFGINPAVMHFDNALLHGVNTGLVYLISKSILPRMWKGLENVTVASAFVALIWAVHPLRVESVAWAVERKDVLFGLFYLLACWNYIRFLTKNKGNRYALYAALFYLLACLSKSMGITFLATAFLLDILYTGTLRIPRRLLTNKVPFVAIFCLALYLYGFLLSPETNVKVINPMRRTAAVPERVEALPPVVQQVAISNMRVLFFAGHTVLPVRLAAVYPREQILAAVAPWLLPLLLIPLVALALLWWRPGWRSSMGFGLAWFAITVSPVLMSDGVGTNFLSDRYTYIPALGLIWWLVPPILMWGKKQVFRNITIGHLICGLIIIVFIFNTVHQIRQWRSSRVLWTQVIDNYPVNWYAYYNRGKLIASDDPQLAIEDLTKSITTLGNRGDSYYTRGTILMQQEQYEAAIQDFTRAIELLEENGEALINRGSCYRSLKQFDNAIQDFTQLIDRKILIIKALNNRGLTYSEMGQYALALQDLNEVLSRKQNYAPARINRGNIYLKPEIAQFQNAEADFTIAVAKEPVNHNAWFRLAYSQAQQGKHSEAISNFTKAIELQPTQGFYFFGRAQSYDALGDRSSAISDYQKAQSLGVRVDPALLGSNG